MAHEKQRYNSIYRLIIAAYVLACIYFLVFSHHGFFLFKASYEDLIIWYPNHYNAIYFFIQSFHIGIAATFLVFIWKLWRHSSDFVQLKNNFLEFVRQEKNALIQDDTEKKYNCKYFKTFIVAQISLLLLSLGIYYAVRYSLNSSNGGLYQLYLSRTYLIVALNGLVFFAWINRKYVVTIAVRLLFTPSGPYNLAVYRIVFFIILGKEYLNYINDKLQFIESKPREALPFIGRLIDIMPISKELYMYVCIAGIISCIFLVFGLFTRFFLFLNAILVFYIISVPNFYGKLWHSQLPIWISWFLVFAPVSDVFSLDRLFFKRNAKLQKSPDYNFPIKIIWLQIGFIYFWSGFHKLSDGGFDWALSQSMINQVRLEWFENFDRLPVYRFDLHPWLLYAGGLLVIFFELVFWMLLFHRWLKYVSIIGGLLMHNILKMILYIGFKELQIQYVVFINFEKVLIFLKKKLSIIPVAAKIQDIKPDTNRKLITTSLVVFGMNFLCGLFQINSFPFSVYPTYSEIIPAQKEYLHYSILDSGKENTNVWELGKNSGFNWEHFARLEYAIIKKYNEYGKIDSMAVSKQWQWWTNQLPELKEADTIDVYIYKRSLNPDSAKIISNKRYLFRLYVNENK